MILYVIEEAEVEVSRKTEHGLPKWDQEKNRQTETSRLEIGYIPLRQVG
jgi:hypothetical protein